MFEFISKLLLGDKSDPPQDEKPPGGSGAPISLPTKKAQAEADRDLQRRLSEVKVSHPDWIAEALRSGTGPLIDMLSEEIGSRYSIYASFEEVTRKAKERSEDGHAMKNGKYMLEIAAILGVSCLDSAFSGTTPHRACLITADSSAFSFRSCRS